ncbi:MAG: J domain-containing protein [Eubacteriales bacterium]|nr:J domain-containing protein [Eubacteriales bacterium]
MRSFRKILRKILTALWGILSFAALFFAFFMAIYTYNNYMQKPEQLKINIVLIAVSLLIAVSFLIFLKKRKNKPKVVYTKPGAKALKELKIQHSFTADHRIIFSLDGTYHGATYCWRILKPGQTEWEQLENGHNSTYTTEKPADQLTGHSFGCYILKSGNMIAYTSAVLVDDIYRGGNNTYHYSYFTSSQTGKRSGSSSGSKSNQYSYTGSNSSENGNNYNRSENRNEQRKNTAQTNEKEFNFFQNCDTKEQITSRYRQLIKAFHPDTGNGDAETAATINLQYEELMKKFK